METFINQFESFYLSNNIPLDKKTKISSLNNINIELPIFHRYLGLIFFVEDIKILSMVWSIPNEKPVILIE